ncbi:hypothetical protein ARSQ2_00996 [Arsenophonus endosymbiont of Bemisia tabaci Q2]|nr:hypothetical protein ARSQ2_00996 [Arsenophonus endosymbiont of Bemisia tabaci Q2]
MILVCLIKPVPRLTKWGQLKSVQGGIQKIFHFKNKIVSIIYHHDLLF